MQSNIFENLNPYNAKISENSRNIKMAESKKGKRPLNTPYEFIL